MIRGEHLAPAIADTPIHPAPTSRWASAAGFGWVFALILVALLVGEAFKGIDPQDEGQFLTYPWLIGLGRMPYRDIWMSYPPLTYLVLVPLFKLGLPPLALERALGIGLRLAYIGIVNRLVSGSWRRFSWLGFVPAFSLVFLASDAKMYPWIVALPLVALGLRAVEERPYVAAALLFVAGLMRFEFAGCGVLALGACGALQGRKGAPWMRAAGILALGTIGFYASLSAITEGAAFRDIFIDQIITVQRGRYIPLSSATLGFLGLPILLATVVLPPIAIILGIILRRPYVTATNLATLVLLPHMLQRFDASHLFSTAALLVPWASITVCGLGRTAPWESQVRWTGAAYRVTRVSRIAVAGVGVWSALIALSYGVYLSPLSPLASPPPQDLPRLLVSGRQTVIADDLGEARDDRRVVSYLDHHATSRQSIMILPASLSSSYTRTDLYFVLGLRPSGRYLEVQPNLETQPSVQSAMVRALHATRWVLLVHGGRWYGPVASAPPTAADRFVRAHFTTVLNTPTYALMRHT